MLDAGVHVGLGVDGSASNERGDLMLEVKQALLVARGRGGPRAMTARDALRLGTRGGAAVLGRDDIGSLEPGKRADIAVWRTDGLEQAGAPAAIPSRASCSRARTASTGSTSAACPSCAAGISCAPTRTRSRASSGPRREHSQHEISTHVLDTATGSPAAGVKVELLRGDERVARAETDADGRARLADELELGRYRLVFQPPSAFFRRVE